MQQPLKEVRGNQVSGDDDNRAPVQGVLALPPAASHPYQVSVDGKAVTPRVQTPADAHELAVLIMALSSGLQNYEMLWMYPGEIRTLWLDGVRILLKPAYTGTYGGNRP